MKKQRIWFVASTEARPPPVPPDLPLCAEFATILGEGKKEIFGANICQKGLCQMRKNLQVKSRRQTAGRVPQIPAVRRFFASAGEKRLALICVL